MEPLEKSGDRRELRSAEPSLGTSRASTNAVFEHTDAGNPKETPPAEASNQTGLRKGGWPAASGGSTKGLGTWVPTIPQLASSHKAGNVTLPTPARVVIGRPA